MSYQVKPGNIFGRIGQGFGKGLAEQIPKEVARTRLSSGLEKLTGSTETNPMKQLAQLYSIPGLAENPELANQALSYLRQQAEINEAQRQQGQGNVPEQIQANLPRGVAPPIPEQVTQPQGIKAREGVAPIRTPQRLQSTPEAIRQGGLSYVQRFPQRYRTIAEGEAQYQKDVANQNAQIANVNNRFEKVGSELLQKLGEDKYADVVGELHREFEKRAEDAVLSGRMSDTEAADHFTKQELDFAKARSKQQAMGPDRWRALFSGKPIEELKAAQKAYKEADMPEVFMNDLIAYQKLSVPRASELSFPLDKEEEKYFKNLKVSKGIFDDSEKVYNETLSRLTNNDSLQNFALQLSKKGYSPQDFLAYVLESGKELTPRQTRELQNIGSFQPSLSDILYFTLIGKGE